MTVNGCEHKDEACLLESLTAELNKIDNDLYQECSVSYDDLVHLSAVFAHFPSMLESRTTSGHEQSLNTLIEKLYRDGCDHTVLLPTKVVVGRAFMVAKFNYLGFLRQLADRFDRLAPHRDELQKRWEYTIFSLLIEDVYQAIIEREPGYYDPVIRREAAVDLIHYWDNRFDRTATDYASEIVDLWRVRKRIVPVFGTMLGTMELMKLSSLLSDRWQRFLETYAMEKSVVEAIEEFVFGLTYEQIEAVRAVMRADNRSVITRDALQEFLAPDDSPDTIASVDPRDMYRFYQRRARATEHRALANRPGPRRTLEENLLVFLIADKHAAEYLLRTEHTYR